MNHATDPHKLFSTFYNKFNKNVNKYAPTTKLSELKAKQLSRPCQVISVKNYMLSALRQFLFGFS